jgi:hypothetical protein
MSSELGSHQGLPVTITATVNLEDLQAKTGMARTGGGTLLPVSDLIRMAGHAYNYLLVFDNAKRCELYRGRSTRLATPAQRLVLYATERGDRPTRAAAERTSNKYLANAAAERTSNKYSAPPAPACPPRVLSCVKRSLRTCSAIISTS